MMHVMVPTSAAHLNVSEFQFETLITRRSTHQRSSISSTVHFPSQCHVRAKFVRGTSSPALRAFARRTVLIEYIYDCVLAIRATAMTDLTRRSKRRFVCIGPSSSPLARSGPWPALFYRNPVVLWIKILIRPRARVAPGRQSNPHQAPLIPTAISLPADLTPRRSTRSTSKPTTSRCMLRTPSTRSSRGSLRIRSAIWPTA